MQPSLFDETALIELIDPDNETLRHVLCKNPETMRREQLLVKNIPVRHLTNQPEKEQQQILDCLGVKGL